ncbi:DUF2752 domain-containing protein [Streptomyces sp. NBC_01537]|uniref:DUF2752 domain-containing protein n=1 Tax=Streptomyces sp. NBC_01537 TaxID=2903896 RepID=UPI0038667037
MADRPSPRGLREAWAGAALLGAVVALVTAVDPGRPGRFPSCPFRAATGWSCPGCGSLRALHDLTAGHIGAALGHNAALVVVLPFAVFAWLLVVSGRAGRGRAAPAWTGAVVLAALLLWTVVRNLPPLRDVLSAA